LDRLHFGARARRRARIRRLLFKASLLSIAAILVGVPGADVSFRYLDSLTGRGDGDFATEGSSTLRTRRATPAPGEASVDLSEADTEILEPPTIVATPSVEAIVDGIYDAAEEFGVDAAYLLSIAVCESHLNPAAYNPAGYFGLFQFDRRTWAAYGSGSIYDPIAQARAAAELLAAGHESRWPNCT
jgi:Transglycosylase SLT domain